jgi:hypothetical protein
MLLVVLIQKFEKRQNDGDDGNRNVDATNSFSFIVWYAQWKKMNWALCKTFGIVIFVKQLQMPSETICDHAKICV